MDRREVLLLDLSRLPDVEAGFIGKCITSKFLVAAKRRVPHASATHRLLIDECENSLSIETASPPDTARKFRLFFNGNLLRLGQLRAREDGETIFDAVMSNCTARCCLAPAGAGGRRILRRLAPTPWLNYAEEKPGSEKPAAIGSQRVIAKNRSSATSHARSESRGETDMRSSAFATAVINASMSAAGTSFASGGSIGHSSAPPDALLQPPSLIGINKTRNTSAASSTSRATSSATSSARQYARARARSHARTSTEASSSSKGESETFITDYQWLPAFYTLEEQKHRLTGEIMNLPARECLVKIDDDQPYRARTADLQPAFR